MKLGDIRAGRDDAPLPAEIEAELDALDAALRGDEVPAGMEGLEALVGDLQAERSQPDPEFSAALDAWAAAGFPRGRKPGLSAAADGGGAGGGTLLSRLGSIGPRRLMPVAAAAATLVVVAVTVSQVADFGSEQTDDGGDIAFTAKDGGDAAPPVAAKEPGGGGDIPVIDEAVPGASELRDGTDKAARLDALALSARRSGALDNGRQGIAQGQEERQVERDAQLTLSAPADEVPDVTNNAIDVVEGLDGIVLSSRVSGSDETARATLDLRIPADNLDAALSELSDLGDVRSRSEGALDITRPFVDAKDRLAELRAERRNLLFRIEQATTDAELEQLKFQLAQVNRQIADAGAEFDEIAVRARYSSVTLQITSEGADEGDWSLDDALDDAGRVLTVGAGIALISAAVLLPLALIAAIAYMVLGAANRRAREKALDE